MNPCPIDGECFGDLSAEVNPLMQTWYLRAFARGEMGGCRGRCVDRRSVACGHASSVDGLFEDVALSDFVDTYISGYQR